MAGQNEQPAVAVKLLQRVAHHIVGHDDIRVILCLLLYCSAIFAVIQRADQYKLFPCLGLAVALHQIHRALFRRDAPHIQDVLSPLQPVFFPDQAARALFIKSDGIGDQYGCTVVFLQKIVPLRLRKHHQIIRIFCGDPLSQLHVTACKAAPLVHLPIQSVHCTYGVLAEQFGDQQRYTRPDGVVMDHIIAPEQRIKGCQKRIDRGIQCRLLQGKYPPRVNAVHIVHIMVLFQAAVIHGNVIASFHQTSGQPANHDLHTARATWKILVPDHRHLHRNYFLPFCNTSSSNPIFHHSIILLLYHKHPLAATNSYEVF